MPVKRRIEGLYPTGLHDPIPLNKETAGVLIYADPTNYKTPRGMLNALHKWARENGLKERGFVVRTSTACFSFPREHAIRWEPHFLIYVRPGRGESGNFFGTMRNIQLSGVTDASEIRPFAISSNKGAQGFFALASTNTTSQKLAQVVRLIQESGLKIIDVTHAQYHVGVLEGSNAVDSVLVRITGPAERMRHIPLFRSQKSNKGQLPEVIIKEKKIDWESL